MSKSFHLENTPGQMDILRRKNHKRGATVDQLKGNKCGSVCRAVKDRVS